MDERERIVSEMHRRAAQIPEGFYALDRPANRFIYQRYVAAARRLLAKARLGPPGHLKVLEVGCGDAQWLVEVRSWGARPAHLHGIDLDTAHIDRARMRLPDVDLRVGDASELPWGDEEFDMVIQSTMFTSILSPDMRLAVAREMVRVLKPRGVVLWYDFVYDNPRNGNVRGIGTGEIRKLFPGLAMTCRRVTLAPPLVRLIVPVSRRAVRLLDSIPLLRTHVVATLRRQPDA